MMFGGLVAHTLSGDGSVEGAGVVLLERCGNETKFAWFLTNRAFDGAGDHPDHRGALDTELGTLARRRQ